MARGKKIPRNKSKKSFSRNAERVNKKNISPRPMRGGIRL